jgi:predicted transposase YdaD
LGIALMVLTTIDEAQAPEEARYLLARSQQAEQSATGSRAIIEMITTIMVYKFEQMSRVEVEAMLNLTLQETRVYQEAKAEGREEGREEGERIREQRGE